MGRIGTLRGDRTILHVTHHLGELLDADRILVLNGGKLVVDVSPERLILDADLLAENRLVLPPLSRLATGLGLAVARPRTPEELAREIQERIRKRAAAR